MNTVSRFEGIELIKKWGQLFDVHASPLVISRYTSGEDFEIQFGDTVLRGLPGLETHHPLKEQFYDECHLYYDYQVESVGPPLIMSTHMVWDTWRRKSNGEGEHLIADLRHRWTFVRQPEDGRPVFRKHELLSLNYRPGATPSESDTENLHIDPQRVGYGKS